MKNKKLNGFLIYKASEESLAKNWLLKEEDEAWIHLKTKVKH
jgi:hypothetical protein